MVREFGQHSALGRAVANGNADGVDAREHVELGDDDRGEPVEARRVAQGDQVEIAAAALAPGGGAELVPTVAKCLADVVEELGRERAGPDARRVRLGDAPHLVDVGRADAGADARRAGDRVRRRDERIGAVVQVEERGLGALEEDEPVGVEHVPADLCGVGDVRLEAVAVALVLLRDRVEVEPRVLLERAQ